MLGLRLWRLTCCFRACFVWGRFLFCSLLVFGFQGPDCLELVLRFFSLTREGHFSKLFTVLFFRTHPFKGQLCSYYPLQGAAVCVTPCY